MWNKILGRRLISSVAITRLALSITRRNRKIFIVNAAGLSLLVAVCLCGYALIAYNYDTLATILTTSDAHFGLPLASIVAWLFAAVVFVFVVGFITMLTKAYTTILTLATLRGQQMSIPEAIRLAHQKFGTLTQFMYLSLTVGLVAQLLTSLDEYLPFLGSITSALSQTAWDMATAFSTPLIVDNKANTAFEAIGKSSKILVRTFGENLAIQIGVGAILGLILTAVIAIGFTLTVIVGLYFEIIWLMYLTASIAALTTYYIMILMATCQTVIITTLYEYAENGNETLSMHKNIFATMLTKKSAARVFSS